MASHLDLTDTIVALSTPSGKSGIAVIRLSGHDAIRISATVLSDASPLFVSLGNTSIYCTILDSQGVVIDDVLLTVYRSPKSFTGEDVVEISSHGSPAIVNAIIEQVENLGARPAEPGEFSRRAFYNGNLSLESLELMWAKLLAGDSATLLGGQVALKDKFDILRKVYNSLIHLLAIVNAQIDFGESDDIVINGLDDSLNEAMHSIQTLSERASATQVNAGEFSVAFVGPPNVGKSSLFNALLSFDRSIVSEIPGTTRDYLEAFIEIEGHRIKLIDTAGDRVADQWVESEGIRLGNEASKRASLTLLVTDEATRSTIPPAGVELLHNKVDLDSWTGGNSVSAKTGKGISPLRAYILGQLRTSDPMTLVIPGSELSILKSIERKLENALAQRDLTLLAEDLRSTVDALGPLLGVNISEDALNEIFQSLCIGK